MLLILFILRLGPIFHDEMLRTHRGWATITWCQDERLFFSNCDTFVWLSHLRNLCFVLFFASLNHPLHSGQKLMNRSRVKEERGEKEKKGEEVGVASTPARVSVSEREKSRWMWWWDEELHLFLRLFSAQWLYGYWKALPSRSFPEGVNISLSPPPSLFLLLSPSPFSDFLFFLSNSIFFSKTLFCPEAPEGRTTAGPESRSTRALTDKGPD